MFESSEMYELYIEQYGGNSLELEEFSRLFRRATATLERYKRIYTVTGSEEAEKMALCAMVDALNYYEISLSGGIITSSSVGSVSSSTSAANVDISQKAQSRELYRCASEYLSIYRGCG